jgi:hypothetical protein
MTKHLSQEQLLRHVDGELSRVAAWQTAAHLKTCWACQVELGKLEEQIATIVNAESLVFGPSLPAPPGPWGRLEPRLQQANLDRVPFWKRFIPFAGRSVHTRLAYSGVALALVVVGLSLWVGVPQASAKEVLARVIAADARRFAIAPRQVVRQRVRVAQTSGASLTMAHMQSWKSPTATYWDSKDPIGAELLARYTSNGLEAALPLSPAAMETWVKVAGSELKATGDRGFIGVEAASNPHGRAQDLESVSLHVNKESWHLEEMTLAFTDATYQIAEEESSIIAGGRFPAMCWHAWSRQRRSSRRYRPFPLAQPPRLT